MTWRKRTIMEMAREVGFEQADHASHQVFTATLEAFAKMVREDEREACAKFLMQGVDLAGLAQDPMLTKYTAELLSGCAKSIRAREQA